MLRKKKLPIVILDERWHNLFMKTAKKPKISELEKKLGELLKFQGKVISDTKELKVAKQRLMEGIVANMESDNSSDTKFRDKKMKKSQQLIQEINDKLKQSDNEIAQLPYKIKEVNEQLVEASFDECYEKMFSNSETIQEVNSKINDMREELKRLVLLKQDLEEENTMIYSYMHDILGSDIMELMDEQVYKEKDR